MVNNSPCTIDHSEIKPSLIFNPWRFFIKILCCINFVLMIGFHCIHKSLLYAVCTVFPLFIYRCKTYLYLFCFHGISLNNSFCRFFAGLLRAVNATHKFHYHMCTANPHYFFSYTAGSSRTCFVVYKSTGTDSRRIAYPAM